MKLKKITELTIPSMIEQWTSSKKKPHSDTLGFVSSRKFTVRCCSSSSLDFCSSAGSYALKGEYNFKTRNTENTSGADGAAIFCSQLSTRHALRGIGRQSLLLSAAAREDMSATGSSTSTTAPKPIYIPILAVWSERERKRGAVAAAAALLRGLFDIGLWESAARAVFHPPSAPLPCHEAPTILTIYICEQEAVHPREKSLLRLCTAISRSRRHRRRVDRHRALQVDHARARSIRLSWRESEKKSRRGTACGRRHSASQSRSRHSCQLCANLTKSATCLRPYIYVRTLSLSAEAKSCASESELEARFAIRERN
ncbi:unnamed protein product [Trichogramma brassicae]|uniref:Uncharacterized protein n=1 Tax=Trichogramma brassicae TaxID=86971 RepID=A0A6H5I2E7_9HYME|nr:unnamed protein product [Trichogramma brassicae]